MAYFIVFCCFMGRGKPIKSKPILIDEKKGKYLIVRFFSSVNFSAAFFLVRLRNVFLEEKKVDKE